MTQEEAIECLKTIQRWTPDWDDRKDGLSYWDAIDIALSALRPVSREQVEKVWRGEWVHKKSPYDYKIFVCKKCEKQISIQGEPLIFCPACGAAQTDEAVDILLKRLEALKDGSTTD